MNINEAVDTLRSIEEMDIIEVIYSNSGKVESICFESEESFMEWRENNPEVEILETMDYLAYDIASAIARHNLGDTK